MKLSLKHYAGEYLRNPEGPPRYKYFAFCAALAFIVVILWAAILPRGGYDWDEQAKSLPEDVISMGALSDGLYLKRIWPPALRTSDTKTDAIYCVIEGSGGQERGLIGLLGTDFGLTLVSSETCDGSIGRRYQVVDGGVGIRSGISGFSFDPTYDVTIFEANLPHIISLRFNNVLGGVRGTEVSDKALSFGELTAEELLSVNGYKSYLDQVLTAAMLNSPLHWLLVFIFSFGMLGEIGLFRAYNSNNLEAKEKVGDTDLNGATDYFNGLLDSLPTFGLIGTMIGLMFTLFNFLQRMSPDPAASVQANSASLGGIVLALSTTIMGAAFLIASRIILLPLLRSRT